VWLTAWCIVRVIPRASRDEIAGWQGEELRVRLRAPPVDGAANEALLRLLATRLGIPVASIELVTGAASRHKRLRIAGLNEMELRKRLQ